jgi:hypothetical protein
MLQQLTRGGEIMNALGQEGPRDRKTVFTGLPT